MTIQHITTLICIYLVKTGVLPTIHQPGYTTLLATRIGQHSKPIADITIAEMITTAKQALADHNPPPEEKKMQQTVSVTAIDKWKNTNQKNGANTKSVAVKIHNEFDGKKPRHEIDNGIIAGQHALKMGETMKKVAIVIGHKITSPGATNATTGTNEYEFNEMLSRGIYTTLNHPSIDINPVLISRNHFGYKYLPGIINKHEPDLIISLHCNAYNKKTSGTEVLYYHRSEKGRAYAQQLQNQLVRALRLKDRGTKPITSEDRGGYLLKNTNAPCLIAEPFFIDNDDDLSIARKKTHQLAIAYTKAIVDILIPKNSELQSTSELKEILPRPCCKSKKHT